MVETALLLEIGRVTCLKRLVCEIPWNLDGTCICLKSYIYTGQGREVICTTSRLSLANSPTSPGLAASKV